MKKIMLLFTTMAFSMGATLAYIDESNTSDIDMLKTQGYSESTLRVIDAVKVHNQGEEVNYVRRFTPKKKNAYTYLKLYVDPSQDDGMFGEHEINYTNSWTGEGASYIYPVEKRNVVENL